MMHNTHRRNGFTLIEIMITVLIIGILLTIALPNMRTAREVSRQKACYGNLHRIAEAQEQYVMSNKLTNEAPISFTELVPTYIKAVPTCPSGGSYGSFCRANHTPTCTIHGSEP